MKNKNTAPNQHGDDAHNPAISPKRKRGGQPGNQNGRKKRLYTRALTPEQRNALRAARRAGNLSERVNVLRIRLAAMLTDPHADLDRVLRANRLLMRVLRFEYRNRGDRWGWIEPGI